MKTLPLDATDEAILAAVREWVTLLAAERYQEAYDHLYPGSQPGRSPQMIQTLIQNYGSLDPPPSGAVSHVTPLETAHGGPEPRHDVWRYDDPTSGYVWFDMPVDGAWSDLTATFDFHPLGDALVLKLSDLHVSRGVQTQTWAPCGDVAERHDRDGTGWTDGPNRYIERG